MRENLMSLLKTLAEVSLGFALSVVFYYPVKRQFRKVKFWRKCLAEYEFREALYIIRLGPTEALKAYHLDAVDKAMHSLELLSTQEFYFPGYASWLEDNAQERYPEHKFDAANLEVIYQPLNTAPICLPGQDLL